MDLLAGRWAAPGRPGPPARSRSRDVDISPGHRPAFDLHPRPPPSLGQPTLRGTEGAAGVRVCDRCGRLGPDSSRGRRTGPGPGLPPPPARPGSPGGRGALRSMQEAIPRRSRRPAGSSRRAGTRRAPGQAMAGGGLAGRGPIGGAAGARLPVGGAGWEL